MPMDRHGHELTTASPAAADAYQLGIDRFLASAGGVEDALGDAIAADPDFALAHAALARQQQVMGDGRTARQTIKAADELAGNVSGREAGHINVLSLLINGKGPDALSATREHMLTHPRDIMVAQTCFGVFSLIGFSGQPGREADQLAFTTSLAPHYGNDWSFLAQHAFAQMEAGQTGPALDTIERAMAGNPKNANAAHIRAHLYYENGEAAEGLAWLEGWRKDYEKSGLLHCHISWHVALWSLEQGDADRMWQVIDEDVYPGSAWGPPLNVMTDMASILYRAELAGVAVSPERWRTISDHAAQWFPRPGLGFADVHAALAHAMAGNSGALEKIRENPAGPAADLVGLLSRSFDAIKVEDWAGATRCLETVMADHARIGGSRAQRDLIEFAMANALLKQGKAEEARRLLAIRRPQVRADRAVTGL